MEIGPTIPFTSIPWDDVLFALFAGTMLFSGLLVVTMRDIIRCGLAMMLCFAALAGIYVIAGAPLVAATQVLVYVGAITVLVLIAIIVTQTKAGPSRLIFQTQAVPAAIAAVILVVIVVLAVGSTDWHATAERVVTDTGELARQLFRDWVLPFEVVGILLLAAVIGAVFLAKRERQPSDEERAE